MATQSFSVCLPLLALLVTFPCSRAGGVDGGSLLATSVLSDVLHKYFAAHKAHGRAMPKWKPEVDAVLSLVESMKSLKDINATTQGNVDALVGKIIDMLKEDVVRTKEAQAAAKTTLQNGKTAAQDGAVAETLTIYNRLKKESGDAQKCHEHVTDLTKNYTAVHGCSPADIQPKECKCEVNSVFDFELTETAKALHWCDFAGSPPETAQSCIKELWTQVDLTRATLKTEHKKYLADVEDCKQKRAKCTKCLLHKAAFEKKDGECRGKHQGIYGNYDSFQTHETAMCAADSGLASQWVTEEGLQTSRVQEWSDLKFVVCIFEAYVGAGNFTQSAFDSCSDAFGATQFYEVAEQLQEPVLNMSKVPTCDRTRAKSPETVPDLEGLLFLWELDKCGTFDQVTINTPNTLNPVAADLGACSS